MKMLQKHFSEIVPEAMRADFLKNAQIVDANMAARWFFTESEQSYWDVFDDFPHVASPWPLCWMELTHPGIENNDGRIQEAPRVASGTLILSYKIQDGKRKDFLANQGLMEVAKLSHDIRDADNIFCDNTRKAIERGFEPAWIQQFRIYVEFASRFMYTHTAWMYLDANGRIDKDTWFNTVNPQVKMHDHSVLLLPFLFALSLLHCKNVKLEDVPVPPKVQVKREKRGVPSVTFKTLVVEPMRQQVRREAAADPTGEQNHIKRALHIARGHFKDYRNGTGLFGKYQDIYWWDMQVRGSASVGEVIKDYRVKR